MTHPIVLLQGALIAALVADSALTVLVGASAVFDAPPVTKKPPYAAIARHDVLSRDGDAAPGHEHRLLVHIWAGEASRKAALAIAERVIAVALAADLDSSGLRITHRQHDRTDTAIDGDTGKARAAIALRFFSEPVG